MVGCRAMPPASSTSSVMRLPRSATVRGRSCTCATTAAAGAAASFSPYRREPEDQYRRRSQGGGAKPFALGEVDFVLVESDLWVANLVGQHGTRPKQGVAPVRYDAIRTGLAAVREFARLHSSSVHMPRIGAGLAGGRWEEIASIVKEELVDHDVKVIAYDLPVTAG